MKRKSIALCIVLSIVTFGIYGIYWVVVTNNTVNALANPEQKTSGGTVVLLSIITCGIYGFFWVHKMGTLLDTAAQQRSMEPPKQAVLYVVLQLFGLMIVSLALMQDNINKMLPPEDAAA